MTIARLMLLAWAALLLFVAPARAAEPDIDAGVLCRVKRAIRFRSPAWTDEQCRRIAAALNAAETGIGKVAVFAANGGVERFAKIRKRWENKRARPARKGRAR